MGNLCTGAHSQMTRESLANSSYRSEAFSRRSSHAQGAAGAVFDQRYEQELKHKYNQSTQSFMHSQGKTNFTTNGYSAYSQNGMNGPPERNRVMTRHTYGNGDHYEGEVLAERRDIRDGHGIFYCSNKQKRSNYEYHGEWKQNLREGRGHCYYYNEDLYVGEWRADRRHGIGELFTRKQDRYKGQWKNDMKDGKGTLTSQNNSSYTGKWYQDKKHGQGEMTGADNQVFIETWKYGVLVSRQRKESEKGDQRPNQHLGLAAVSPTNISITQNNITQLDNTVEKTLSENSVSQLLTELPKVSTWSVENVQKWLQLSSLSAMDDIAELFISKKVDGARLLCLTEQELAEVTFGIKSLGRRKKIIRAITFLKASVCRSVNNGGFIGTDGGGSKSGLDLMINRSHGSHQFVTHNRSNLNVSSIDKSAVLSSAQSFFQTKARGKVGQLGGNRLQFVENSSLNTSGVKQFPVLRRPSVLSKGRKTLNLSQQFDRYDGFDFSVDKQSKHINLLTASAAAPEQMDPESQMALGQDAGLIEALGENGFDFFIDYKELQVDPKADFIGRGGYGDVFKARWLGTRVAVKKFGKRMMARKALKDFIKEIEMLNQLRHPNIVLYMGVSIDFEAQSYFYMITEFVAKGSLFDLLHQRKVVLEDARITKVAKQIAIALLYLQSRSLYHCDLKSQNVLINDDWTVKLCDFGLSRYQQKFEADNHGKIGTPHWMAPEILRGEKYTSAADVYSFGVILWEMLTLDIPFKGRSIPHITGMVGYHRETLKVPPQCNSSLRKIVNNCLLYEPERRPLFEHIVDYLTQIEKEQCKDETVSPVIVNKLVDFLY